MKRFATVIIAIMLIGAAAFSAFAAGISLTLKSSMPIEEQAAALEAYIAKLPGDQQEAWYDELAILASNQVIINPSIPQSDEDDTVYIADSGKRYHQDKNCRGLNSARNISAVTKDLPLPWTGRRARYAILTETANEKGAYSHSVSARAACDIGTGCAPCHA